MKYTYNMLEADGHILMWIVTMQQLHHIRIKNQDAINKLKVGGSGPTMLFANPYVTNVVDIYLDSGCFGGLSFDEFYDKLQLDASTAIR